MMAKRVLVYGEKLLSLRLGNTGGFLESLRRCIVTTHDVFVMVRRLLTSVEAAKNLVRLLKAATSIHK